jgi:hypothetical protein
VSVVIVAGLLRGVWVGEAFAYVVMMLGVYALPALLFAFVILVLLRGRAANVAARVLLQAILCLVAGGALLLLGPWILEMSIEATQERGEQVVAEVEAYRQRHGRYPRSLASVEEDTGKSLPGPTLGSGFHYHVEGDSFTLYFSWGFGASRSYDRVAGEWTSD